MASATRWTRACGAVCNGKDAHAEFAPESAEPWYSRRKRAVRHPARPGHRESQHAAVAADAQARYRHVDHAGSGNNPDPFAAEIGGQGGVRNAHIFFDNGFRLEKIFIFSHPPREDLAPRLYDEMIHYGYRPEGLRPHLADAVQKRNPRHIGLNMSRALPMADGLTVSLKRYLDDA